MELLPDDVLVDVLGRLAPRSLAASRSVCTAWRAVVDGHRLLRTDLLPLSLAGIYVVYHFYLAWHEPPTFFSRPSIGDRIHGDLGYLDADWSSIGDHCNGLILFDDGVANPATRQWVRLPPYPEKTRVEGFFMDDFLAFDPTVSPHFEVFFMHCVCRRWYAGNSTELDSSAWPPSPYVVSAFSSKTWRWEERSFVREGTAVRSFADVAPFLESSYATRRRDAVYWRGRLYVYQIYFIIRLSLEDNKYRVIRLPPMNEVCRSVESHFGKSEKGVYYGFTDDSCKLQMWFLDDSAGDTEWMLKDQIDLTCSLANFPWDHGDGSWSIQDDEHEEGLEKEKPEWDSDNEDGVIATATSSEATVLKGFDGYISILVFHPYKEVIFLHTWSERVMAYHLNSSKLEDLGCLPIEGNDWIMSSCTYTPCWMEELLEGK